MSSAVILKNRCLNRMDKVPAVKGLILQVGGREWCSHGKGDNKKISGYFKCHEEQTEK